ncbi:MAG: DUF1467 family protein [Pseudomonadota bacterium]
MSIITVVAFYFILWWLTFFAVLPIGVRTQGENDDVTLGTVSSAPSKPMIWRKMAATTVLSAAILGVVYAAVIYGGLSFEDVPFVPDFD